MPWPSDPAPGAPRVWHGAVLAGGASRRFGRDKAFALVDGRPMLDWALGALRDAAGVTVLLGAPERAAALAERLPPGVPAVADDVPGRGPLGGLATVLGRHPNGWVALLAVDLPRVPATWWARLAARHRPGAFAIVPRAPGGAGGGRWEPTAALYHGSLAVEAAALLAQTGPVPGFQAWLDALDAAGRVVAVPVADLPVGALVNVNRPEDAARLGPATPPNPERSA